MRPAAHSAGIFDVRLTVVYFQLDLLAQQASGRIDLVDSDLHAHMRRNAIDVDGARQVVQRSNLYGVALRQGRRPRYGRPYCGGCTNRRRLQNGPARDVHFKNSSWVNVTNDGKQIQAECRASSVADLPLRADCSCLWPAFHKCREARSAPSLSAANFIQAILGS